MNEFELIARYFTPATRHTLLAGGDDAALLVPAPGRTLAVTTDMLVEGTHFLPAVHPESLGHKVLAVNLSDIAAMGGIPRWAFLSMALPAVDEDWLRAFAKGLLSLAEAHGVDLAGGDTTRGHRTFNVTLIGEVEADCALRRDGALEGDDLWVSGRTGEAALGLMALQGRVSLDPQSTAISVERLDRPTPRVALGQALIGIATGAIDVSDGLVADIGHVAERSRLRAVIEWARVPQSPVFDAVDPDVRLRCVLAGGDDYELAFTAPPARRQAVEAAADAAGVPVARIGAMAAGRGVTVVDPAGRPIELREGGFDHFR